MSDERPPISDEAVAIAAILHEEVKALGEAMADRTEMGAMVCIGGEKPDGSKRRWLVALMTNDVADHFQQWAEEQAKLRRLDDDGHGGRVETFMGKLHVQLDHNPAEERR